MIRAALFLLILLGASGAYADDEYFMTLGISKSAELAGLLDYILPTFKSASNVRVRPVEIDPGGQVASAESGGANALLLDDWAASDKIMSDKFGIQRRLALYDDAVIIGPKSDPAGIRGLRDAGKAFAQIAAKGVLFVSRGDGSRANQMELRVWKTAGIQPDAGATWYRISRQNRAATLGLAAATNAYTLAERASWANFADRRDLEILSEGDPSLFNIFVSVLVDPEKESRDKYAVTRIWYDWLNDKHGFAAISSYRINDSQIFIPCQGPTLAGCQAALGK
jgi:tungstate transport system substrate-binding protein